MLKITRIDTIGTGVPELEPQVQLLERLFGFRAGEPWLDDDESTMRVRLSVPGSSDIDWEVAAPVSEHSDLKNFIDSPVGPGIHHVLLQVPDLQEAIAELRRLTIEPRGEGLPDNDALLEECSISPEHGGNGFLFRLRHSTGGIERPPPVEDREDVLGIIALNHLSHAYANRDELALWYTQVFGMDSFHRSEQDPDRPFVTAVMETPTRQMRWEVLQPFGHRSFVQNFLDKRGPGIHHVTFEVSNWGRALSACELYGVATFGERNGVTDGSSWREAFIHPRQTGGILVQFFWQERPGIWV